MRVIIRNSLFLKRKLFDSTKVAFRVPLDAHVGPYAYNFMGKMACR